MEQPYTERLKTTGLQLCQILTSLSIAMITPEVLAQEQQTAEGLGGGTISTEQLFQDLNTNTEGSVTEGSSADLFFRNDNTFGTDGTSDTTSLGIRVQRGEFGALASHTWERLNNVFGSNSGSNSTEFRLTWQQHIRNNTAEINNLIRFNQLSGQRMTAYSQELINMNQLLKDGKYFDVLAIANVLEYTLLSDAKLFEDLFQDIPPENLTDFFNYVGISRNAGSSLSSAFRDYSIYSNLLDLRSQATLRQQSDTFDAQENTDALSGTL